MIGVLRMARATASTWDGVAVARMPTHEAMFENAQEIALVVDGYC
jgi:hypothetical protein